MLAMAFVRNFGPAARPSETSEAEVSLMTLIPLRAEAMTTPTRSPKEDRPLCFTASSAAVHAYCMYGSRSRESFVDICSLG